MSDRIIMDYIGAYPQEFQNGPGLPAPPLDQIPQYVNVLALSFARGKKNSDGSFSNDGNFFADWDLSSATQITAEAIKRDKEKNPKRTYLVSLAGDRMHWNSTNLDRQVWIENAFRSLSELIQTFHLDGIDINFENGLNQEFVECIVGLAQRFSNNIIFTLGPWRATWEYYRLIFQAVPDSITWINYQVYAEIENQNDPQLAIQIYNRLNVDHRIPWHKLLLGLCSNQAHLRGLQVNSIGPVSEALSELRGAFIWTAENSYYRENGRFAFEAQCNDSF